MKARGKREAQRNASPWLRGIKKESTESAKYQRQLFRSFRASRPLRAFTRGDAPHVVRRLPLAFIFRAFGASLASFFAKQPNRRKGEYSELMLSPFLICLTLITGALAQDNQSPKPTATIMVTGCVVYEDTGQPATRHRVQLIASESLLNSRSCLRQRVYRAGSKSCAG